MSMRPQDIVVSVKLALTPHPTYPDLAKSLDLSLSEVHGAVKRATAAGLVGPDRKANRAALLDFLLHGVKHAFVPKRGQLTRGIPTAHAAPPLDRLVGAGAEPPPVWPDPEGSVRGESFAPLYRSVPKAAKKDPKLYEALCLIDAIRGGRTRDYALAEKHLRRLLLPATASASAVRFLDRTLSSSEPRRQRLLRALARVGPGPENHYRGALDILDREPPLAAGSLLVAHLAREIESSVRQVLNEMKTIDRGPSDDNSPSTDDSHRESIRSALEVLGISTDSPLAQDWFGFSGQWNESGLHKRAHREQLSPPRPIDSDFLSFWETFEGVLDQVLESLDKRYLIVFDRLDKLLAISVPRKKDLQTLRGSIPQSPIVVDYFFTKLENPAWLQPLERAGFFARPPASSVDSSGTVCPSWPALKYLKRIAALAPSDVTRIALAVPATDNFRVHEGLSEIALSLPATCAAELVDSIDDWLEVGGGALLAHNLTTNIVELVKKLAIEREADAAVHVLHSLLRPITEPKGKRRRGSFRDDPRARLDDWDLRLAIDKLSPVIASLGWPALEMLSDLLEQVVLREHEKASADAWDDHSWIWRPAIENHARNRDTGYLSVLVSAIRDVAVHLVDADVGRLPDIVVFLEARRWIVFRRLALHILERFSSNSVEVAASRLLNRSSFESHRLVHEYCRLLRASFGKLSPSQRDELLSWIDAGPKVPAGLADRQVYADRWRLQYLTLVEDALPESWRTRFDSLKSAVGPQTPPDHLSSSERFVPPPSALSSDELAEMTPEHLVKVLAAREPSGQFDRFERTEIWRAVSSIVEKNPEKYAARARSLELLDPHYLYGALSGFRTAIRENRSFEWADVLALCVFITSQRKTRARKAEHVDEDGEWGEACKAVLWLLSEGMTTSSVPIPVQERTRVWSAIEATLDDPDGRGDLPLSDPMGASLNRVRGIALLTAIDYALWVARGTSSRRLPAEVSKALEFKLRERSDAIRAVFGSRIHVLVYLDGAWCKKNVRAMFRRDEGRDPAWAMYLAYGRLNLEVFRLLRWRYKEAVREMKDVADHDHRDRAADVVGSHLGQLYWHGKLRFGERDALLETFFADAPPSVAGQLIEVLGLWLHEDTPPSSDVLFRLRDLWEKRVAMGHKEELVAYGRWFSSARFADEWSLDQLQKVLSRAGYPRADQEVAARLTGMIPQYLPRVVVCLELLTLADDTGWGILNWKVAARTILTAALASNDEGIRRRAEALINRLSSKGHLEFRTLLRKGEAA